MVPIMFSAMFVQASDRRSSFGSFNRTTVRISIKGREDAGRYAGPLLVEATREIADQFFFVGIIELPGLAQHQAGVHDALSAGVP